MIITYHGFSCIRLEGQKASVIIDPFDGSLGLRQPKYTADLVLLTSQEKAYSNASAVKDGVGKKPFVISGPGEYEAKGVLIYGVRPKNGLESKKEVSTLYKLDFEKLTFATLGRIDHNLSDTELEKLEGLDILFVPVGGGSVMDAKQATQTISQIEPRIVIPIQYSIKGIKEKFAEIDLFKKEIGITPEEGVAKFRIAKKDLPTDEMKVVILSV